jgi:hypothetical protein
VFVWFFSDLKPWIHEPAIEIVKFTANEQYILEHYLVYWNQPAFGIKKSLGHSKQSKYSIII